MAEKAAAAKESRIVEMECDEKSDERSRSRSRSKSKDVISDRKKQQQHNLRDEVESAASEKTEDGVNEVACTSCCTIVSKESLKGQVRESLWRSFVTKVVPWFCEDCRTCSTCGDGGQEVSRKRILLLN